MEDSSLLSDLIRISITIAITVGLAFIAQKIIDRTIDRIIQRSVRPEFFRTKRDEELREKTLSGILKITAKSLLWFTVFMVILSVVGINLAPLFAGAGIVGLAVGFGAQSLVADVVSGVFILIENQYRVGDYVEFNKQVSGTVESFSLRTTVLRDLDGMQHHIANGEIKLATNMTVDFAQVNLDIGVGYDTDMDKLEKVINEVGNKLAEDENWKDSITEPPQFLRVNEFGDSAIIVKILGKTVPEMQWAITGELRKQLKIAFDKNGIEIPFPQRVVHQTKDTKNKN